jgi:hypothetical protein
MKFQNITSVVLHIATSSQIGTMTMLVLSIRVTYVRVKHNVDPELTNMYGLLLLTLMSVVESGDRLIRCRL